MLCIRLSINFFPLFFKSFVLNSEIHNYETRLASTFYIQYPNTKLRALSIPIAGVKLWNTLSPEICRNKKLYYFEE